MLAGRAVLSCGSPTGLEIEPPPAELADLKSSTKVRIDKLEEENEARGEASA